jgi:hypothetical protein
MPPQVPMRIFILTLGTRGDFEPFWALGRELGARGHSVTIGTSAFHVQNDPALTWLPIGTGTMAELLALLKSMTAETDFERRVDTWGRQWVLPALDSGKAEIGRVAAQSDYFISNLKFPLKRGDAIFPGAFVSYDPPPSLESARSWGSVGHGGATVEIVAMNRALIDPADEWDDSFHFTGFWQAVERHIPLQQGLAEFVAADAAPVVMTMGSMVTFDADRLADCFLQALEIADLRGVLVAGWSDMRPGAHSSGRMIVVPEADYDWLFARACCVVHHGGIGTVASVLRAGVVSIVLPQIPSQQLWGHILALENLSAATLDTASLDPYALARVLRRAADDERLRRSAQQWKARVAADRGLPQAADLVEDHWRRIGGGHA